MVLLLYCSYADILGKTPMLSDAKTLAAVPEQLSNPTGSIGKVSEESVPKDGGDSGHHEFSVEKEEATKEMAKGIIRKPPG